MWVAWALLLVVLLTASVLCAREWIRLKRAGAGIPLPVMGAVPDFSLTERSGRMVTLKSLSGHVWVADFVFTRCGGPCPVMSQHMSELQTSLGGMPGVRLVTFTVDPDYDTPQVLAAYATRYNADAQRWLFLTGDQSRIRDLSIHGFKLGVADNPSETREPGQDAILHSTSFVLVDAAGRIRGYYNGDDAAARHKLRVDIHRLLRERAS